MLTTLLAYLAAGHYFVIDICARQGNQARSLVRGQYDRGSTVLIGAAFTISGLMLLAAPVLNDVQAGRFPFGAWVGRTG
jgi:hypothetical protein